MTSIFPLNAIALAALVRSLGERRWFAMIRAGVFGAVSPEIHSRFGHMALCAH